MSELQPLQRLAFAAVPKPARDLGTKGELAWLPLSQLYIDPSYQRHILDSGKANIRRMIENFSWERFGVLDVTRRGPKQYAIVDGQHRATAAFNHGGIDKVPCCIGTGDVENEARAFSAINANVTRIHPLQSFRAAVAGGDPDARRIATLCADAGVTIAPYPKNELRPGETCALNAIRTCFHKHGERALVTALIVLRAADPRSGLPGTAVRALCDLAPKHPEWHRDAASIGDLLARRGKSLAETCVEAQARRMARGGTEPANFAAIVEAAVAAAPKISAAQSSSGITPPTRAQLMGRR